MDLQHGQLDDACMRLDLLHPHNEVVAAGTGAEIDRFKLLLQLLGGLADGCHCSAVGGGGCNGPRGRVKGYGLTLNPRHACAYAIQCKCPGIVALAIGDASPVTFSNLDRGGYFIVNGVEKALLGQEKLRTNFPYIFPCRAAARFEYVCEVRSCHELKMRSTSTLYIYITRSAQGSLLTIAVQLPFIDNLHVPLVALFRLLGAQGTERGEKNAPSARKCSGSVWRPGRDRPPRAPRQPQPACRRGWASAARRPAAPTSPRRRRACRPS